MRRKRFWPALATIVVAATTLSVAPMISIASGSGTGSSSVKVKPRTGSPTSRFRISFRAPQASGRSGGLEIHYAVDANATGHACTQGASAAATAPRKGALVHVLLSPGAGRWCIATYHGSVEELGSPYCEPGRVCPQFVMVVRTVGRFKFVVRAPMP